MSTLAVGLAGCDNNLFQGPLAVRESYGGLEIAVCTSGSTDEVVAYESARSADERWSEFLRASGELALTAGTIIVPAREMRGLQMQEYVRPHLTGGSELDISVNLDDSAVASALFLIPDGGLPIASWLQPDGTVTTSPCRVVTSTTQDN
ncbi:MAG: hypothetical protein ABWY26_12580 [Microbacterium sp.]